MNYTTEQISTVLQMLNELQVSGINNCSRVAEITRILQNPTPVETAQDIAEE